MIPQKIDTSVMSTMTGRKIDMKFDASALVHLQGLFINMYPEPKKALLREYSNNAWDAQIEAGYDGPIEITLPSSLSPTLHIKDHGTGLNEQDIEEVYSLYGASTKRETNKTTGSLGIGSKSALAYGSQFTVIGIKNGIRTVVGISRDEDGVGTMTIEDVRETEECNGVEIIIPVKQHDSFKHECDDFFQYWPEGSVLVNEEEPKRLEGLRLSDNIMLAKKGEYYEKNTIIMGGVPYSVPQEVNPYVSDEDYRLVAWVGIGEVTFTPDRENLSVTKLTRTRMATLKEEIEVAIVVGAQKEIDTAESPIEAMRMACDWRTALNRHKEFLEDLTYKGIEIPVTLNLQRELKNKTVADPIYTAEHGTRKPGKHSKGMRVEARTMLAGLVVRGYDVDKFTPNHKRKLEIYAREHDIKVGVYILSKRPLDCQWIPAERVAKWADIKPIKLERNKSNGSQVKVTGSYETYETSLEGSSRYSHHYDRKAADIDTTKPIYYFTISQFGDIKCENDNRIANLLFENKPICTLVRLGQNRVAKFLRDFPAAKDAKVVLETIYNKMASKLGDEVLKAWKLREEDGGILKHLDGITLDDPNLREAIRLATLPVDAKVKRLQDLRRSKLRYYLQTMAVDLTGVEIFSIGKEYPLLDTVGSHYIKQYRDDIRIYLNAAYAARKETA